MSAKKKFKSQASPVAVNDQDTSTVPVDHWPILSNEVILFILRLLPQKDIVTISMINKRFRDLSRDASLWKELTLDHADIKRTADSCRKLVERCKKLETLKITNKSRDSRPLNIMSVVIRAKDSLRSLDVDNSLDKWTDAAMTKLGQMKGLKNISFAFNTRYPQNPRGLFKLVQLDQLEVLKIYGRTDAYGSAFLVMKNVFQQLKQLKIVELGSANSEMVVALASNNPGLKKLKVFDCEDISDESIDALSDKCPYLEELGIDLFCSDEIVPGKFSFPKLKHLDIAFSTRKLDTDVDETLTKLVMKLKCLKKFNLRGFLINSERVMITGALYQTFRNQYPEMNFMMY